MKYNLHDIKFKSGTAFCGKKKPVRLSVRWTDPGLPRPDRSAGKRSKTAFRSGPEAFFL